MQGGQTLFKQLICCVNSLFLLNPNHWLIIDTQFLERHTAIPHRYLFSKVRCSLQGSLEADKFEPTAAEYETSQESQKTGLKSNNKQENKQTKTSVKSPWVAKGIMMEKVTQICLIDYFPCPLGLVLQEVQKSIGYISYKSWTLKALTM